MKTAAYTTLLFLLTTGLALGQAPGEKFAPSDVSKIDFSAVDKDANGRLSKEEALPIADLEGAFDKLDTDHDGAVTPAEFSHWSRADKVVALPHDPTTAPSGSAGAQHMPSPN